VDGSKEIRQIDPNDNFLAHMWRCKAANSTARHKSMGGRVRWKVAEQTIKNPPLDRFQSQLRAFNQPGQAMRLLYERQSVMHWTDGATFFVR
jgi:hypothetical protein